ncbi:MAG: helix-turn-helix domain-containing protein [Paludibacterium sp.]|uniref:YdaS family helix-turn-helix protein n=1 Tax=Paludibacterium sp. TaxID=1917523 RepID=UPI0025F899B2|nr:YdaS family helix-turn-helix protein [Paludibacterium sp.]MBV8048081.1 helix-turn-helix domain-containing protein [Paludibacterium sp.]
MGKTMPRSGAAIRRAVRIFNGQIPFSLALGISQSVICEWSTERKPVPAEQCPRIERLTRERGEAARAGSGDRQAEGIDRRRADAGCHRGRRQAHYDINTMVTKYRADVLFGAVNKQPQMSGVLLFSQP